MKNKLAILTLIIYAAAAIIWIINSILHFYYDTSLPLKILSTIAALIWCLAFAAQLFRYRKNK